MPESKIVAKRRNVVTFYVSCLTSVNRDRGGRGRLGSSRLKSQQSQGSGGFMVAKRRIVVSGLCVSKLKSVNSHRDRGGPGRETQHCRHFWTRPGSSRLKSVNSRRDRGGPGRETQTCRHFWTRPGSSRLKSVNSHRDRGGPGRETQTCRHWSSRLKSVNSHRDRGGPGRETQTCRHFWTRFGSSRLKSVNSHRDRGGSWSRNAALSSLLDSSRVFASQECQQ